MKNKTQKYLSYQCNYPVAILLLILCLWLTPWDLSCGAAEIGEIANIGKSEDKGFLELAPKNSLLLVGCDNFSSLLNSIKATTLGDLWETDEMQAFLAKPIKDMLDIFNEEFDKDFELKDMPLPTGIAGFSVFIPELAKINLEEQSLSPADFQYFAAVDFGDNFETFLDLLETAIDRMNDDEETDVTIIEDEFEGRTIYSFIPPEVDREKKIEELKEQWGDDWDDDYINWFEEDGYFDSEPPLHVAIDNTMIIISTVREKLDDAILSLDDEPYESIADNEIAQTAINRAGGRDGLYGVILLSVSDSLQILEDSPMGWYLTMFIPGDHQLLSALGILDIQAIGLSSTFGLNDTIVETQACFYTPLQQTGLFNLIAESPSGFKAANWVDPDILSYSQFYLNFKEIVPLIRSVINTIPESDREPESVRENISVTFETQVAEVMTMITETLGPQIHLLVWDNSSDSGISQSEANSQLFAIACSDELMLQNTITTYTQLFPIPIEARDFLGYRMYDIDTGIIPIAIGIGKKHLFFGTTTAIEQVLRTDAESVSLTSEDNFISATDAVPGNASFYNYTSIKKYIKLFIESLHAPFDEEAKARRIKAMRDQYEEWGILDSFDESLFTGYEPDWYNPETIPQPALLEKYLGDLISYITKTDDGLVIKYQMCLPTE